jgi:hypothetical protein
MSISKRKLAANYANAQKSTGPTSREGRQKVSQNATKHGLCGRFKVLPGENQENFDNLFEQFMQDEQPVGSVETELVRRMAEYTWLRDRAARFQNACFHVAERTPEDITDGKADIHFSPELERFLRYQAHFDRSFARASAELLKRKKERRLLAAGFDSEKRAHAAEIRAEKRQQQRDETHYLMTKSRELVIEAREMKLQAAAASQNRQQAA